MKITQNIIWLVLISVLIIACNKDREKQKEALTTETAPVVLTDSIRLLKHIDSLSTVIQFPYLTSDDNHKNQYKEGLAVNLSEFKDKQLFKLSYQRINSDFGNEEIEYSIGDEDSVFNLTGSDYRLDGVLVGKTPEFLVIHFFDREKASGWLVTISHQLKLIDAIRSDVWEGNSHYQSKRSIRVFSDLKFELLNYYSVQTGETEFDAVEGKESWFIDSNGYIRKIEDTTAATK